MEYTILNPLLGFVSDFHIIKALPGEAAVTEVIVNGETGVAVFPPVPPPPGARVVGQTVLVLVSGVDEALVVEKAKMPTLLYTSQASPVKRHTLIR